MDSFDLAIAYDWEYDIDFIQAIEKHFQKIKLSTYIINYKNIEAVTHLVKQHQLKFSCLLDRASDVDENFLELNRILTRRNIKVFNPYKKTIHAIDKSTMHLEFLSSKIHVPYSIIIPPHSQAKEIFISVSDLAILGRPFVIKPCNTTGGGLGVVKGAESLKEVLTARMKHSNDKYIIQEKIYPLIIDGNRAWFRCFWAFSKPICTWWDDNTHIYNILRKGDVEKFNLKKLFALTRTIQKITGLDFFSTEIALTSKNRFVVIDYVNDQCDMRFKSLHNDGVPDEVISDIIIQLGSAVEKEIHKGH